MTIRPIKVPGLPEGIEVRRSTRRTRTVGAHREGSVTVVVVPERMPMRMISRHAIELHERIMRRGTKTRVSNADLFERAAKLRSRYLPKHTPQLSSIRWVTNQHRRWGSCTPVDQTIRLSSRLQNMPDYVVDYVILHELAHLLVSTHGPEFKALVALYPHATKAEAFLQGVEFAGAMDPLDADEPTAEPEPA